MDRRGFLKLLGIGAGAAAIAATLPDILTPDDEEFRRYWQGWTPRTPTLKNGLISQAADAIRDGRVQVGGYFPDFGERHDIWGTELKLDAVVARDFGQSVKGSVLSKGSLFFIKGPW